MQSLATYFAPADWTRRAFEFLSTLPRNTDFPELASFDRTILEKAGLCEGELEWTLLTNRLASIPEYQHRVLLEEGSNVGWQLNRNVPVRQVFEELARASRGGISLREISRKAGVDFERVEGVVRTMIEGPRGARLLHGVQWRDEDNFSFTTRGLDGSVVSMGPHEYPATAPLLSVYASRFITLGAGAWGTVGTHLVQMSAPWTAPNMEVAIKLIEKSRAKSLLHGDEREAQARLFREFKIGREHDSPRMLKTLDLFETRIRNLVGTEIDVYCLVMELVRGEVLSLDFIKSMDVGKKVTIALALARAVAEFHKHGVHRDIKPANSILRHETDDVVVLIDYGIAKGDSDDTLTDASSVFDPYYASPQQILQVEDATKADDVYSLGLSIAEICTGEKAYSDLRRGTVLQEKQKRPYDSLALKIIDKDMHRLVVTMTSPDRGDRPNIDEVTAIMEKVLHKVRLS